MWTENGGNQQLWKIEPVGSTYKIINVHSGKALEVAGSESYNGANIQQWDYYGGDCQLWYLTLLN